MNLSVPGVYKIEMDKGYPVAIHLFGEKSSDEHNDPDQSPITITLPSPPAKSKIANYNRVESAQKFYWEDMPVELKQLQVECRGDRNKIYKKLWENKHRYQQGIAWIEQEWDRRLNGYWFYNNGFAVYMPPTQYFWTRWWRIDTGLPDFRDRDWLSFLFWDRVVVPDPNCVGEIYMKHRREGATNRAQCKVYEFVSRRKNAYGGIQSKTEIDAGKVFTGKLVPAWTHLPFFFKPIHDGSSNPQTMLRFIEPSIRGKGSDNVLQPISLGGQIDFGNTKENAYDGTKLHRYHGDEYGKITIADVNKMWRIVRTCLVTGAGGKASITTTVEEMQKGGKQFKELWELSDYGDRNENNQTTTGLYRFFLPATIGLEDKKKFYNEYGVSDIQGAEQYLNNQLRGARAAGDTMGVNELHRQYPRTVRESFRSGMSNDYFNNEEIQKRLEEFTFGNPYTQDGYLEWIDKQDENKGVRFVPDPGNKKFRISQLPPEKLRNAYEIIGGVRVPGNRHMYVGGADPFKYDNPKGTRRSKGGIAIKSIHDPHKDPFDKPVEKWTTGRFVLDYLHRPATTEEYAEDTLMAHVFYGCLCSPEIDIPLIMDHFKKRGYIGYLYFGRDERNRVENTPGENASRKNTETMFGLWAKYLYRFTKTENHDRILEQCNEVAFEAITDYDLFVAGGQTLMAEDDMRITVSKRKKEEDEAQKLQKQAHETFPYDQFQYQNGKSVKIKAR